MARTDGSDDASCFGGLLERRGDGSWRWIDGEPEPRMHEMAASEAELDWRRAGFDDELLEVPFCLAEVFDALRWLLDRVTSGEYDIDVSSGLLVRVGTEAHLGQGRHASAHGIMRILVPRGDWQRWCARCPIVPLWAPADEAALQALAIAKGRAREGRHGLDDGLNAQRL